MSFFGNRKGTTDAEESNLGSEEFNEDIAELMARDDIQSRTDIFKAEYEKAQNLMNNPTSENQHRAYDLMGNLASQFDYMPAILWMGNFVEKRLNNIEQAAYWYKKAADMGNKSAARHYAQMLMTGKGIQHDQQLAMYYYELAVGKQTQEAATETETEVPEFSDIEVMEMEENEFQDTPAPQTQELLGKASINKVPSGNIATQYKPKVDDNTFPMKWHYFFIAILDLYAVAMIVSAFKILSELGYFGENSMLFAYTKYPLLKQCDTYRGCSILLIGVYTFIVAFHLIRYRKGILGSLVILHLVSIITNLIYYIWGSSILGISMFNYANIISLALTIISLIINCIYYTKRIDLFVN